MHHCYVLGHWWWECSSQGDTDWQETESQVWSRWWWDCGYVWRTGKQNKNNDGLLIRWKWFYENLIILHELPCYQVVTGRSCQVVSAATLSIPWSPLVTLWQFLTTPGVLAKISSTSLLRSRDWQCGYWPMLSNTGWEEFIWVVTVLGLTFLLWCSPQHGSSHSPLVTDNCLLEWFTCPECLISLRSSRPRSTLQRWTLTMIMSTVSVLWIRTMLTE